MTDVKERDKPFSEEKNRLKGNPGGESGGQS